MHITFPCWYVLVGIIYRLLRCRLDDKDRGQSCNLTNLHLTRLRYYIIIFIIDFLWFELDLLWFLRFLRFLRSSCPLLELSWHLTPNTVLSGFALFWTVLRKLRIDYPPSSGSWLQFWSMVRSIRSIVRWSFIDRSWIVAPLTLLMAKMWLKLIRVPGKYLPSHTSSHYEPSHYLSNCSGRT